MAARYDTGNPVPSNTMMDLSDNVQVLDELLNKPDGNTTLRTGEIVPVIQQQVAERIDGLTATAQEAIDTSTANAAVVATDKATVQSLADTVTTAAAAKLVTTITPTDPDGTIAGLSATTDGQAFYVAQGTAANIAMILYKNVAGVAVAESNIMGKAAVDAVAASVSNISPLNPVSAFSQTGIVGSEFENVTDEDILLDKDNYIIKCIRQGNYQFFIPVKAASVLADTLTVGGTVILPGSIPPLELTTNLSGLANSSTFYPASDFDVGGQFEAYSGYTDILLDKDLNFVRYIKNGVFKLLIPSDLRDVNVDRLTIGGVSTDALYGKDAPETRVVYSSLVGGKSQVFKFDNATGVVSKITDGTSNETNPSIQKINSNSIIAWDSDRDASVPGGKFYQNSAGVIHPMVSRSVLVGWGDSFMDQAILMSKLHLLTGLPAYNFGKSSVRSNGVAARQGGTPFYCMPVGGTIPATGSVNITPNKAGPLSTYSGGALGGMLCNLAGVDGQFNWDGTQATFTRSDSGTAVSVPDLVPLFVYPITTSPVNGSNPAGVLYSQHDEAIVVITCGRNNINYPDLIVSNISDMVAYLKTIGKKVVVCPQFTDSSEISGTTGYIQIHTLNQMLKAAFPNYYCEINGIDLMQNFKNGYNPANATDVQNIADDTTPDSLRTDALHPSQVLKSGALEIGAERNANFIYQFMQLKGWVN